MVSHKLFLAGPHDAKIHCSLADNELTIRCNPSENENEARHSRRSLDGILLNCCSSSKPFKTRVFSLYDVLSATLEGNRLAITVIRKHHDKKPVKTLLIENPSAESRQSFVDSLWQAAYPRSGIRKRAKVLLNPFGGAGKAKTIWSNTVRHIFVAAQYVVDVQETEYAGHASHIANTIDLSIYDVIVCISGDGLPHEVVNGLAQRTDALAALKLPIAFIPAGSGNGSSKSIYDTHKHVECALAVVKGTVTPIDLMSITQGDRRFISYFSLSYGVIADCDLATEHLRWMGEARFTYGVVQRVLTRTKYPCTLSLSLITDDKASIRKTYHERQSYKNRSSDASSDCSSEAIGLPPLRYGTVLDPVPEGWITERFPKMGTFYAGLMPYMSSSACFFPTASPAAGTIDVLHIQADIPFLSALTTISAVDSAKHFDSEYCYYAKCDAFRLVPDADSGYISVDGERVPFSPLQGEIHHALGNIITKNGQYYSQFWE